jgi:hypothetical protein
VSELRAQVLVRPVSDAGRLLLKSRIIRELEAEIERLRAELRSVRAGTKLSER